MRHPSQIFLSAIPRMTFEKGFVSISAGLNPQITQQSNSSIHENDLTQELSAGNRSVKHLRRKKILYNQKKF